MYPGQQVWDSKPDDGEPRFVAVSNAAEAIARDPKRYSRKKPEVAEASDEAEETGRSRSRRYRG